MSGAHGVPAGDARSRRLRALGVAPYRLRGASSPKGVCAPLPASGQSPDAVPVHARCVLVLPDPCPPRALDLVGRAMHAFGADFARAPRLRVQSGGLTDAPPHAAAYVAFGEAQARALGHVLPTAVMRQAEVVLLDAPQSLHAGAAKRQLWLALKALRRRLRES